MTFPSRRAFGHAGQDIIIKFLEKHFGYRFEAGERCGETLNVDLIEELEHCVYIPPSGYNGSKLLFTDGNTEYRLTMPDVFMSRDSSSGFYWIEAKRHTINSNEMIIDQINFDDYRLLYEKFTRQEFYAMCLNPRFQDNAHDLYWCEFQSLIDNVPTKEVRRGNPVYTWSLNETMTKLNKYPINISSYK